MYHPITECRVCKSPVLTTFLDLGDQALTGVFPKTREQVVERGPIRLVKCVGKGCCGLVQMAGSYDPEAMYGDDYGYRSGLNATMTRHLHAKVQRILEFAPLQKGDLVVDIGSNDGTTLGFYPDSYRLIGVDPTGPKFRQYYPPHVELIAGFFSPETMSKHIGTQRARVVTSFSMFYDLEAPLDFMRDVLGLLEDDGIWVFEQSYLPAMLATNSYDTACHEHLEYYSLSTIKWMADKVGGTIVDVEFNDINGGSFSVTMARAGSPMAEFPGLAEIIAGEVRDGIDAISTYEAFAGRAARNRDALVEFIDNAKREGKLVCGLGASTKGNVVLQYCGLTEKDIAFIGEVNSDKFGAYTPGTLIPIISEEELIKLNPDYVLVLPWHFRGFFDSNPKLKDLTLVYPLPELTIRK